MAEEMGASIVLKLVDNVSSALAQVGKGFDKFGFGLEKNSGKLKEFGNKMSLFVTTPMVVGFHFAMKAANELEDAVTDLHLSLRGTPDEVARLDKGLKAISQTTPAAASELMNAAKAFTELGVSNSNLLQFTHNMAAFGTVTQLSTEEAGRSIIELAHALGVGEKGYGSLGSAIVNMGRKIGGNRAEMLTMAERLAPVASDTGLSTQQVLGLSGFFTRLGISGMRAGNAVSQLLMSMQSARWNNQMGSMFGAVTGLGAGGFEHAMSNNPMGALQSFITGLQKFKGGQGFTAGTVLEKLGLGGPLEARVILLAAKNMDQLKRSIDVADEGMRDQGLVVEEANKKWSTYSQQMKILENNIGLFSGSVAQQQVPMLEMLNGKLRSVLISMNGMSDSSKKTLGVFAIAVAGIGPGIRTLAELGEALHGLHLLFPKLALGSLVGIASGIGLVAAAITTLYVAMHKMASTDIGKWMLQHAGMEKGTFYGTAMNFMSGVKTGTANPSAAAVASAGLGKAGAFEIVIHLAGEAAGKIVNVVKKHGQGNLTVHRGAYAGVTGGPGS